MAYKHNAYYAENLDPPRTKQKNLHIPNLRNLRSIGKNRNDMCLYLANIWAIPFQWVDYNRLTQWLWVFHSFFFEILKLIKQKFLVIIKGKFTSVYKSIYNLKNVKEAICIVFINKFVYMSVLLRLYTYYRCISWSKFWIPLCM